MAEKQTAVLLAGHKRVIPVGKDQTMENVKPIRVTFDSPTFGYWDDGAKTGGEFTPEYYDGTSHPGPNCPIKWDAGL